MKLKRYRSPLAPKPTVPFARESQVVRKLTLDDVEHAKLREQRPFRSPLEALCGANKLTGNASGMF